MRLTAFLVAIALTPPAFAALPLPSERERWLTLTAAEFQIYSNAPAAQTQKIAADLIRMREGLGKVTRLNVRSPLPTRVLIFRSEASFAPLRDVLMQRRATNITGLFLGGENRNYVLIAADADSSVDRIVYHELTHQIVRNTVPSLPLWFSEGIAEYYSTFRTTGNDVYIGALVTDHVNFLREGTVIPLKDLFAINHESPDYREGLRQGVFYAESWALVHYMFNGSDTRREQFPKFLALLQAGKPTDEAFRTAFQGSYDDLERELRNYVRRLVFSYRRYSLADFPLPEIADAKPAARDAVLVALGDVLAHSSLANVGEGETFLKEAIRINPTSAEAHATLGSALQARHLPAEADAEYEKAIQLGSADAEVYVAYGSSILARLAGKPVNAADTARARPLFQRATELDPRSARAWGGLGATYIGSDDVKPGIAALEKSLSLAGAQEDVAFSLIQLYGRAGRRDDARRLYDTVLAHGDDPQMRRRARESLHVADAMYAQTLLEQGKVEEAAMILHEVEKLTTNDSLRQHVTSVLSEVDRQAGFQKQASVFDAAVAKANAGKPKEALAMVDALLPQITDKDLKGIVQRFRDEVARRVGPRP